MTDATKLGWLVFALAALVGRSHAQTNGPEMNAVFSGREMVISWADPGASFVLLESTSLTQKWFRSGYPVVASNTDQQVAVPVLRSRSGFFRLGRPSSVERIRDALANNLIDEEAALIYEVYAAFADPRLPEQFRGDDSFVSESGVMTELAEKFHTLSAEAQALLQPFRIPPVHEGSWWSIRNSGNASRFEVGLASVCGVESNRWNFLEFPSLGRSGRVVRVWWPVTEPDWSVGFGQIQKEVQKAWPELTLMMGNGGPPREPLSDDAESCNGGGDAFDIYIVRGAGVAQCVPYGSGATPVYLLWPAFGSPQVLAHELMHAVQFTYPEPTGGRTSEWRWWMEATAEWAMDYVYGKTFQGEHNSAPAFLQRPGLPLETADGRVDGHEYGAYLWPFYLVRKFGNPFLIPETWERSPGASSLNAIAAVIPEGHSTESLWPEFARFNWNLCGTSLRPPSNCPQIGPYLDWDDMTFGVRPQAVYDVRLAGAPDRVYELPANVPPRAAFYYHFRFSDPNARSVAFFNPFATTGGNTNGLPDVQALLKIEGEQEWKVESWKTNTLKRFCRDVRSERVEELLVIIANSDWTKPGTTLSPYLSPRLAVNNLGCWRWSGTASEIVESTVPGNTQRQTWTATYTFERTKAEGMTQHYRFLGGSGVWQMTGTFDPCTYSAGPESFEIPPDVDGLSWMQLNNFAVPGVNPGSAFRRYDIVVLQTSGETTMRVKCPDSSFQIPTEYDVGFDAASTVLPNGIMQGGTTNAAPGGSAVRIWTFAPERE